MITENPPHLLEEPGCLHVDSHGGKHDGEIILEEKNTGTIYLNSLTKAILRISHQMTGLFFKKHFKS